MGFSRTNSLSKGWFQCYKVAMRKPPNPIALTRTERKAAETDVWVRNHLASIRVADDLKTSQLKALRLARDRDLSEK
jgi:hypothetical protein